MTLRLTARASGHSRAWRFKSSGAGADDKGRGAPSAEEYGISVASRPSAPCLATRFPYNTRLTVEALRKVEQGEQILREMGFTRFGCVFTEQSQGLKCCRNKCSSSWPQRQKSVRELKALGYDYVTLDLEGFRSGSMDLHVRHE